MANELTLVSLLALPVVSTIFIYLSIVLLRLVGQKLSMG
ncbi:hypothetical protein PSECIP111951_03553 [Pseudoalteromonas holothuriae]|uniref:Uncharacterized protein n=1 Tax=Pseudoalteromonas holothuriae TaxID=2963714 RepID=A0A9W4R4Z9_9GAMM|nr:hypothetical protein PSECIP111951_03553 [Pseudoalteromonas sp. CIP111951]CAH9067454.1 hypothetical protein PSECIP111854_04110 [Pseudoalteromonas sp. CIP111854]